MIDDKVCWGIAGLGKVAHRFASDLVRHVDGAQLYAVAARDKARAVAFAQQYDCHVNYGSYQQLAEDPHVDVIYIATIHPFHKDMVELFLQHGKHVFVEKPAFINNEDWREMSLLASRKKLLLLEAMKTMAFPAYRMMRNFIKEKQIVIDSIEAGFGNWHQFDSAQQIFNPDLSGGATLDVGVYGLWLYADLCKLMGSQIRQPQMKIWQDNAETQVDENVEFIFDGTIKGKIRASITRNLQREALIKGPELEIVIREKWWNPRKIDIVYQNKHHQIKTAAVGGGFEYEIQHMSELISRKKLTSDIIPNETSQQVASIMEHGLITHGFSYLVCPR